ncbi:MAG: LacI family DNA-binding transcriptional regulator [Firmicutes bacterium]|uniref:LacI family DNA-binding transcriptional regulator n=1 Tax=Candidatus Scybalomonas excrementavium TaxID=2840943 RepID=A0A9D9I274_9FIRM|nr:LacI family DNA-binding transcriptional regulator [Candidatus Scybalomonas excrementavium]
MKKQEDKKKVTLKDIAKVAGVSVGAVSLILNNKPCRISKDKKELVKKIAREQNYVVNQMARALVTKRSYTLALVLPDIQNTFFSSLAHQLEKYCREKGYYLILVNTDDSFENEKKLLMSLDARGVDGIFIIQSKESYYYYEEFKEQIEALHIPYVMIDRAFDQMECRQVRFNNKQGGYIATKYLIEENHRKIACIYMDDYCGNGTQRMQGYKQAMEEAKLEICEQYLIAGDNRFKSGYEAAKSILESDVTAVLICNDMMTLGFLKGLHAYGKCVPKDISIVSYDNSLNEYLLEVELTTVDQNVKILAKESSKMMLALLEGESKQTDKLILEPELIIRKSVVKR